VKSEGAGPPVVFIHGFAAAINWWDEVAPELAIDHRVIRIDLIGHGGTAAPSSGYAIERQAALVAAILDKLGVDRSTVIGHSLGGEVATALAELEPKRIERLIFIDSAAIAEATFSILADAYFTPVIGEFLSHFQDDRTVRRGARSKRSDAATVPWLPQPLPAVDGFNGKIAGFGGGADHIKGLYGGNGSLSMPLAQQWGAQIDGGIGSLDGSGWSHGAGHVFWRDPSIGLVGAYGSYTHWNGIGVLTIPRIGVNVSRFAAEGEHY